MHSACAAARLSTQRGNSLPHGSHLAPCEAAQAVALSRRACVRELRGSSACVEHPRWKIKSHAFAALLCYARSLGRRLSHGAEAARLDKPTKLPQGPGTGAVCIDIASFR
jgi:hypothetical protein